MSRIGKKPIKIPEGVNVTIGGEAIKVSGPLGNLERRLPGKIDVKTEDGFLKVSSKGDSSMDPIFGTTRSHVQNMLIGVSTGWSKTMELVGVGYRGELVGKNLSLALGFSHPVIFEAPNGITFKIEKIGINEFEWQNGSETLEVHIFKSTNFSGEPQESEEMKPQWFLVDAIPLESMWYSIN